MMNITYCSQTKGHPLQASVKTVNMKLATDPIISNANHTKHALNAL